MIGFFAACASSEPNIDPIIGVAAATAPNPFKKPLLESETWFYLFS